MGQLYPNPISSTAGITIVAGSGLSGGGTAVLGGTIFLSATGGASASRQVYTVTPVADGLTQVFQITSFPVGSDPNYYDVFVNGVLQSLGTNYTFVTSTITFTFAPATNDVIEVVLSNPAGSRFQYQMTPATNGIVTSFSFPTDTPQTSYVDVFLNGLFQTPTTNYALNLTSGTWALVMTTAPLTGDILETVFAASDGAQTRNNYQLTPAADGVTTSFGIVGGIPTNPNLYLDCYVNGIYQTINTEFHLNLVAGVWKIVFTTAPLTGDTLDVVF